MIEVLKGANVGTTKLGKINLPSFLQAETKRAIANMTRYSSDSQQVTLLNEFITACKTAGVWSKIAWFNPLFLANTKEQMAYDVVSGASGTFESANSLTLDANGLISGSSAYVTGINFGIQKSLVNNFFGASFIKYQSDETSTNSTCYLSNSSNSASSSSGLFSASTRPMINVGTFSLTNGYKGNGTLALFNIKNAATSDDLIDSTKASYNNGLSITKSGSPADVTLSGIICPNRFQFGGTDSGSKLPIKGAFSFAGNGTALSAVEQTALYTAMNALRTGLLAL